MKKLIMTDLDCTLLPMDQEQYIRKYFNEIARLFYDHGYDGKELAKATMKASQAMMLNNGQMTNARAFERGFCAVVPQDAQKIIDIFPQVYGDRYDVIKEVTSFNPYAEQIVELMREKAQFTVVATQPMFPVEAVEKRLSWTGLKGSMFDHITVYDNSSFCKPDVGYYQEIMDRFGATAEETLMIGNDVNEDILPCEKLGVDTFLVMDGLINVQSHDITNLRKGKYEDLIEYLRSL